MPSRWTRAPSRKAWWRSSRGRPWTARPEPEPPEPWRPEPSPPEPWPPEPWPPGPWRAPWPQPSSLVPSWRVPWPAPWPRTCSPWPERGRPWQPEQPPSLSPGSWPGSTTPSQAPWPPPWPRSWASWPAPSLPAPSSQGPSWPVPWRRAQRRPWTPGPWTPAPSTPALDAGALDAGALAGAFAAACPAFFAAVRAAAAAGAAFLAAAPAAFLPAAVALAGTAATALAGAAAFLAALATGAAAAAAFEVGVVTGEGAAALSSERLPPGSSPRTLLKRVAIEPPPCPATPGGHDHDRGRIRDGPPGGRAPRGPLPPRASPAWSPRTAWRRPGAGDHRERGRLGRGSLGTSQRRGPVAADAAQSEPGTVGARRRARARTSAPRSRRGAARPERGAPAPKEGGTAGLPEQGPPRPSVGARHDGGPMQQLPASIDLPALEHRVLERWQRDRVFERSLEATRDGEPWVFYEGPPTANGKPGTHHVEARVFKDLFPRFRTMQGRHVPRKAGWDCHGLPVELAVEKELGFSGKQDIEAYGVAEFNARCRESVLRHVDEFERMTTRMGYWCDLGDAYRTMDSSYVESVWWSLKRVADQGLLVEDHRVAPYCPRCGTALSDHEVAQGYQTVTDPSVYVRFPVTAGPLAELGAALLVWTTTPWTLVSNTAVAVNPTVTYVAARAAVDGGDSEVLVVAEPLLGVLGEDVEVLERFPGTALERTTYARPFDWLDMEGAHFVALADYVTVDSGTGLVHQAPAFGAEDLQVGRRYGLPVVNPVRPDGTFEEHLPLVGGQFFKAADRALVTDLEARGLLYRELPYEHPYPHCWRCDTALLYYALPSWYIRTTAIKDRLVEENERTRLVPRDHPARAVRRLARQQHRLGAEPQPLLGHAAAGLALHRRRRALAGLRRAGRARRGGGPGAVRARPAPPVRRRRRRPLPRLRRRGPAGAGGHRRLVRLRRDAVRPGRLPRRGRDARLPGAVHLRGDRPDPRLVLHAHDRRDAGLRPVVVRDGAVPRPHPGRRRPQDEQAPRQRPGPARDLRAAGRRRAALVHALRRLALVGAARRARAGRRGRAQGPADLLEHRVVPQPVRHRQRLVPGHGGRRAADAAGPVGALAGARHRDRGHRGARGLRLAARRPAPGAVHRRRLQLVRPQLAAPLLGRRPDGPRRRCTSACGCCRC